MWRAARSDLRITQVLINNQSLGKITNEQRAGQLDVWQTSLHNPGFATYATLCGALGLQVERADQLDGALLSALAHPGPALIEVLSAPDLI